MIDRGILKRNAKAVMRRSYWTMFVVALIGGILSSGIVSKMSTSIKFNDNSFETKQFFKIFIFQSPMSMFILQMFATMVVVSVLISMLYSVFIGNALEYGVKRYFLQNVHAEKIPISMMFIAFKEDYWNIIKIMLVRNIKTLLWFFLFIIPGIVKSYEYQMIPYILAEDSSMQMNEVFARTRDLTYGKKADLFILDLSFIGWLLLGFVTFGISKLFLSPYIEAVYAEAYISLKENIEMI